MLAGQAGGAAHKQSLQARDALTDAFVFIECSE